MSTDQLIDSTTVQQYRWAEQRVFAHTNYQFIAQVYKDKSEDDENADKSENTEETLEDEVNENDIQAENIDESL